MIKNPHVQSPIAPRPVSRVRPTYKSKYVNANSFTVSAYNFEPLSIYVDRKSKPAHTSPFHSVVLVNCEARNVLAGKYTQSVKEVLNTLLNSSPI